MKNSLELILKLQMVEELLNAIIGSARYFLTLYTMWIWVIKGDNPIKTWAFLLDFIAQLFEVASRYIYS